MALNHPFGLGKTKVSWRVADLWKTVIFWFLVWLLWIWWFSFKITEIRKITRISQIYKKTAPLRRRVKTAVIQRYFNHSGAHFLPRTSQNQFFGVSSATLLKFTKFPSIALNLHVYWNLGVFRSCGVPDVKTSIIPKEYQRFWRVPRRDFYKKSIFSFKTDGIMWIYTFPIIPVNFLEIAEIPCRTHRPRATCPDHEIPKELHRFWRGKSAPGSPKSAQVIPKPQL